MNKKALIVIVAIVLVAATAALVVLRRGSGNDGPLILYGNVDIRDVELAFRQPGRIQSMAVEEGDPVEAGQLLASLDAQPFEDALHAAEAEVAVATAELDKLKSGSRPQEIAQAEAGVSRAEAALRNAEHDFKRQTSLLDSGASSQRIVDAARSQRDQAAAALRSAQEALSLARTGARSEDIAAGKARLAAATAHQAQAETALADTRLTAPTRATVITRVREPGSMVGAGTPVYALSLRDPLYVRAYVSEPQLGRIAPGTKVQVETDSSTKPYEGQIGFISPTAEFTPKSVETTDLRTDLVYRLRIVVGNADQGLRQGMPVTVRVLGKQG